MENYITIATLPSGNSLVQNSVTSVISLGSYCPHLSENDAIMILAACSPFCGQVKLDEHLQRQLMNYFDIKKRKIEAIVAEAKEIHAAVMDSIAESSLDVYNQPWTINELMLNLYDMGEIPYTMQAYAYHLKKAIKVGEAKECYPQNVVDYGVTIMVKLTDVHRANRKCDNGRIMQTCYRDKRCYSGPTRYILLKKQLT